MSVKITRKDHMIILTKDNYIGVMTTRETCVIKDENKTTEYNGRRARLTNDEMVISKNITFTKMYCEFLRQLNHDKIKD